MKFNQLVRGTRAESEPVDVPGYEGVGFRVRMRPLTGIEHEAAYEWARKRAIEKGVADPSEGNPIYDLAVMAAVVAWGAVDPDSPVDARVRAFDSPVDLLENMHPEQIVYLHERHDTWQDACSPYTRRKGMPDLEVLVREVAGPEGEATFMRLSLSTRVNFSLSMARVLAGLSTLREIKSSSISGSSSSSEKSVKTRTTPTPRRKKHGRSSK